MRLVLLPYDEAWPARFDEIASVIAAALPGAFRRIDHIGSTSVPGLLSKDVIDVQVTVDDLASLDGWPDRLGPFVRRPLSADHVPPGEVAGPEWAKGYWTAGEGGHLHVREAGRANQRYALLVRDHLRAVPAAAEAYGRAKVALARAFETTAEYADAKDPVCDLIHQAAERWAREVGWTVPT